MIQEEALTMDNKTSDKNKIWVEAPKPTQPIPDVPTVQGVYISKGEDVEWFWTHTEKGSYVSGYKIRIFSKLVE
jgi:hypothetical protein